MGTLVLCGNFLMKSAEIRVMWMVWLKNSLYFVLDNFASIFVLYSIDSKNM